MKKNLLLLMMVMAMSMSQLAWAQITNFYSFSESSANYTPLTGATVSTASGDDGEQTAVPIGFNFNYDQINYSTVTIGVNGAINFTLSDITYSNNLSSTYPKTTVAALWDDLNALTADSVKISYKTEGTTPNRKFIVEWKNISWRTAGNTVNFQIILEETSNTIKMHYGPNYSTDSSRTASIGLIDHIGGAHHFLSVLPGTTSTASDTIATNNINLVNYPGNGTVYTFNFTPPSCFTPSSLIVNNLTTTSTTLAWNENGSANAWDIEYGPTGFTQGTGTVVNANSNPFTINSLTASTTYDAYVRANCGGSTSNYTGPITFTTNCASFTAPYAESFDSASTPNLPNCFNSFVGSSSSYAYVETISSSSNSYSGGQAAKLYNSSDNNAALYLITPSFSDLTTASNQIRFYAKGGSNYELIVGTMTNNSDTATFTAFDTIYPTSSFAEYTILFDASYTGSGTYIAFKHGSTSTYHSIYIDQFVYEPIPNCPPPSAQVVNAIGTTTATLAWTENGSATSWDIEYGPAGFTQGTGTIVSANANPFTLTNLTTATAYDWYVRATCSATDSSTWFGVSSFTTNCNSVTAPYAESFDSVSTPNLPTCFNSFVGSSSSYAYVKTLSSSTYSYSGGQAAKLYNSSDNNAALYLITPSFSDLTTGGNQIRFYAKGGSNYDLIVGTMSNNMDTSTFAAFDTIHPTSSFAEYTILFDASYTGNGTYVAFKHGTTSTYQSIYIDQLVYEPIPNCPPPSAQVVNAIGTTTATLAWTENGSATSWDIEYGPAGFTQGTGTIVSANANPFTLTNLTSATAYDWYVRATCSATDSSTWFGVSSFTTNCNPVATLPWTEGFEGLNTVGSGIVPVCMTSTGDFASGRGSSSYNRAPHTDSTFVYTKWTADDWIITPAFNLTAGTSYDFSYYYVTDGNSGWTSVETKIGMDQDPDSLTIAIGTPDSNITNTTYQKHISTFTPSASGVYYIGIHVVANYSPWYMSFDDFKLEVTPSCAQPLSQILVSKTDSSATVNWTETGSASRWDIEYGPTGFTQGTGTMVSQTTNKPYTFTNLSDATTYDWYVRANCGASSSSWEGPHTFTTNCLPESSYPYKEGFETSVPPTCWTKSTISGSSADWDQHTGTRYPAGYAAAQGTEVAYFNAFSASSGQEAELVTNVFDVQSLNNPVVSFFMFHDGGYTSSDDRILFMYNDGNGWATLDTISRHTTNNHWANYKYDISTLGNSLKFRFDAISGYGNDVHIDGFYLGENQTLNLGNDTTICAGQTYTLNAIADTNFSFAWYEIGSTTVLDTTATFDADTTGTYYVVKTDGFVYLTDTVMVTISPAPQASMTTLANAYCQTTPAITLSGIPAGGTFSGSGINGNIFNPAMATPGTVTISYTFNDSLGCSYTISDTTHVDAMPIVTASTDTAVCIGDSIKIGVYPQSMAGVYFSEYIEGSSNHKALEIYNGTNQNVNLDQFSIMTNYNGNAWSGQYHFPAGTSLASGDVFVIANENADTTILAVADDTLAYNAGGYVVGFNGDDVRALYYHMNATDSVMIDIIGAYDLTDPGSGWDVAGVASATANHTLVRKPNILHGDTSWTNIAGIDAASSQYIVKAKNDFSNIGMHTVNTVPVPAILWSTGATTSEIFVSPTTNSTYTATITNGGCQVVKNIAVNVHQLPSINLGTDDTLCNTNTITLDAGANMASYLWSDNSSNQTLVIDSNNLMMGANTIWAQIVDNNGCENSDTIQIIMKNCLGFNNAESNMVLKAYPNPTNGMITLDIQGVQDNFIVELMDAQGRIIETRSVSVHGSSIQKYNLSNLSAGLYQIRLKSNNISRSIKIIVK